MTASDVTRTARVGWAGHGAWGLGGRVRVAFVLFGGMIALQSSQTLDATKIAYLVGTVLCLLGALAAIWSLRRTQELTLGAPWIAASAALTALVVISFFVARSQGTPTISWLRDVSAYALFAAIPVFALDGQASTSRRVLVGLILIAGLLGGLSWAVEWLARRHILELPFARLVFPSGQLPGMLYLFAIATALTTHRRRVAWVMVAGGILGLFLLTGTRASLLLLVGPVAMVALAGRARLRSSVRSIALHALVAFAIVVAFQVALALPVILGRTPTQPGSSGAPAPSVPNVLGDRFGSLPDVLGNPGSDHSFTERVAQYRAAWALFVSSPVVGVGPGHSINWVDISGYPRTGFTVDTPLVMPAKFGLLGILVFLAVVTAYAITTRTALRQHRASAITLTLVGYGLWMVFSLPLGFPIEDKGASLAVMLLLALALAENAAHPLTDSNPSARLA